MDVYRLPPRSVTVLQRRLLLSVTPLAIAAAVVGLMLAQRDQPFSFAVLAVATAISLCALSLGLSVSLTRTAAAWRSYELSVSDDGLVRRQAFLPDLALTRSEVTAITMGRNGALLIRGANSRQTIIVPSGIERHEELRAHLSSWHAIAPPRRFLREPMLSYFLAAAVLGLMAATMLSDQPAVVVPAALVLIAILVWAFLEIQNSPNLDQRVKSHAQALFFPIAFLAFRVAFVLGLLNA